MELNSYIVFLTAAEEMNFTNAARRLYMTQQGLSGHIRRMEEYYHVRLFERRPVLKLTTEGESMVFYARQILESERAMASRFADLSPGSSGILRFGISNQRSNAFFPGIWSRYHALYQNISVRLHEKLTVQLLDALRSGELDLIVGMDVPNMSDLIVEPLAQEQMRCIVHESVLKDAYPTDWESRLQYFIDEGVRLSEIKELPLILPSGANRLRQPLDRLFRKYDVFPRIVLETASHSLLLQLGCQGGGAALVNPVSLYEQMRLHGSLPPRCHSLLLRDVPKQTISLAWRAESEPLAYVNGMIECIREEFSYYVDFLERYAL